MNNYEIRLARISDIPDIMDLLREVLDVHHLIRPDIFKENATKYNEEELIKIINNHEMLIYVYVLKGIVVGHLFCKIIEQNETNNQYKKKTLFIDDLCIKQAYRGSGIGKSLYDYCYQKAKDFNCDSITLNVWNGNSSAIKFYEKIGFNVQKYVLENNIK